MSRKRQRAASTSAEPPAKKRYNKLADKQELARAVLYLSSRYVTAKSGKLKYRSLALHEEARLLLGVENSANSLSGIFGKWRKAERALWEQMQKKAEGNEADFFADLIEREEELKNQHGTVTEPARDKGPAERKSKKAEAEGASRSNHKNRVIAAVAEVGSATAAVVEVGSATVNGPELEEAAVEGEGRVDQLPKREEGESGAKSNATLHYDLGDTGSNTGEEAAQGEEAAHGATRPQIHIHIESMTVNNYFGGGGANDSGRSGGRS